MKQQRITSIDLLRGVVIVLMALDHVRMYFGYGTWYAEPTNLASTTPLLFFTRWVTHYCAPVFVLLAGISAYLSGIGKTTKEQSRFLLTRGLWFIFAEIVIINFAWTFDVTYSFIILQVIWAIGISLIVLSALIYLPGNVILGIGLVILFGHNLLDSINVNGNGFWSLLWYTLHQQKFLTLGSGSVVNFVYPVLPWIGVMAIGYTLGNLYHPDVNPVTRRRWLLWGGLSTTLLFMILRGFNFYGEPTLWSEQSTRMYSFMSFLNTTKYPPSLHFLLMTLGPTLIFLSVSEKLQFKPAMPLIVLGKVSFFFYIVHLYFIHMLALLYVTYTSNDWHAYILSADGIRSGSLSNFGLGIEAVYIIWALVIAAFYPLCRWYQSYKSEHPEQKLLSYL